MNIVNVKDWFKTLPIKFENYYVGRLDNKKDYSLGFYNLENNQKPQRCLMDEDGFETLDISILIHYNDSFIETNKVAKDVYEYLKDLQGDVVIDTYYVSYIELLTKNKDVDTDEKGIYEQVIQLRFYYN